MFHLITKLNVFNKPKESSAFSFNDKYSTNIFYGIMPDIRAAEISIVKEL
jgi:hypothetical protein